MIVVTSTSALALAISMETTVNTIKVTYHLNNKFIDATIQWNFVKVLTVKIMSSLARVFVPVQKSISMMLLAQFQYTANSICLRNYQQTAGNLCLCNHHYSAVNLCLCSYQYTTPYVCVIVNTLPLMSVQLSIHC